MPAGSGHRLEPAFFMTDFLLFYIPCKDSAEAGKISRHLLDARLIACANIIPGMTSIYRWEGQVTESAETLLLVKSHISLKEKLIETVCRHHSYECPCVAALPIDAANSAFLAWLESETGLSRHR